MSKWALVENNDTEKCLNLFYKHYILQNKNIKNLKKNWWCYINVL